MLPICKQTHINFKKKKQNKNKRTFSSKTQWKYNSSSAGKSKRAFLVWSNTCIWNTQNHTFIYLFVFTPFIDIVVVLCGSHISSSFEIIYFLLLRILYLPYIWELWIKPQKRHLFTNRLFTFGTVACQTL